MSSGKSSIILFNPFIDGYLVMISSNNALSAPPVCSLTSTSSSVTSSGETALFSDSTIGIVEVADLIGSSVVAIGSGSSVVAIGSGSSAFAMGSGSLVIGLSLIIPKSNSNFCNSFNKSIPFSFVSASIFRSIALGLGGTIASHIVNPSFVSPFL